MAHHPILPPCVLACGLLLSATIPQAAAYTRAQGEAVSPFGPVVGRLTPIAAGTGSSALADAGHAATAYARVPAPGAGLLPDGGPRHSPVPEPAGPWLGLAGVAALALRRMHEVTTARR